MMMDGGDSIEKYDDRNLGASSGDIVDESIRQHDSCLGKLFVGGIAWETTRGSFTDYFCKYGEVTDTVIMMNKFSKRSRGFGFVTFADPAVAYKVLQEDHVMDGKAIQVKRPDGKMGLWGRGVQKFRRLYVGGLAPSVTEDELKEYCSSFGNVVKTLIMFNHDTGRSRGFGYVTFDYEEAVERILSDGRVHVIGGKSVEMKRAFPKRYQADYVNKHCDYGSYAGYFGNYIAYWYGYGYWVPMYGYGTGGSATGR